jgi:hypothetical protein
MRDDVASEESESEAGETADAGEEQAFGEDLTEDTGASGSEGEADGYLALTGGGASEQKIGEVCAGEEKNEAGEGGEDVDGLGKVAVGVTETPAARSNDEDGHLVVFFDGHGGADVLIEPGGEGGANGFVGDAGPGTAHDLHPPLVGFIEKRDGALWDEGGLHADGEEDVGRDLNAGCAGEAVRVDSNNGDGDEIELDGFADDVRRTAEDAGP